MRKNSFRLWSMIPILAMSALILAACSSSASEPQTSIDSDTAQSEEAMMDDEEHEEGEEGEEHKAEHINADLPTGLAL